ncbi:MAG: hypothetical protein AAFQ31_05610 [Planctomycetota bacterium]
MRTTTPRTPETIEIELLTELIARTDALLAARRTGRSRRRHERIEMRLLSDELRGLADSIDQRYNEPSRRA